MKYYAMALSVLWGAMQVIGCSGETSDGASPGASGGKAAAGGQTATGGRGAGGSGGESDPPGLCGEPGESLLLGRTPSPDCGNRTCGDVCDPCQEDDVQGGGAAGAPSCSLEGVYRCNVYLRCDRVSGEP